MANGINFNITCTVIMDVNFVLARRTEFFPIPPTLHPPPLCTVPLLHYPFSLSHTALSKEAAMTDCLFFQKSGREELNSRELRRSKYLHTQAPNTHIHTQTQMFLLSVTTHTSKHILTCTQREECGISASNWMVQGPMALSAASSWKHTHTRTHTHACTPTHTIFKGRLGEISKGISRTPSLWQDNPFVYALHCVCVCVCVCGKM